MRYFVSFLAAIGLIILAFVLIFTLTGRNSTNSTKPSVLTTYAYTTKVARLTVDGNITGDSTHRELQTSVGQDQVVFNVLGGYNGNVVASKAYNNNAQAYQVFLDALAHAGFDKGNTDPALGDERGSCPTGRRYVMDVWDGSSRVSHLWTTSCGGGTFKGNINQVLTLFQRQVPDYDGLTINVTY